MDELTDLTTHHIEGIAYHGDTPFSMPLISHIRDNLWVGGCRDGAQLPAEFRHVVSLYPWEKYALAEGTQRVEHRFRDAAQMPDIPTLYSAAGYVLGCLRQGQTLVHCQAGLNRSGLVTSLALVLDGMEPEAAIELLRERRSSAVLCNPVFAAWLRDEAL